MIIPIVIRMLLLFQIKLLPTDQDEDWYNNKRHRSCLLIHMLWWAIWYETVSLREENNKITGPKRFGTRRERGQELFFGTLFYFLVHYYYADLADFSRLGIDRDGISYFFVERDLDFESGFECGWFGSCFGSIAFDARYGACDNVANCRRENDAENISIVFHQIAIKIFFEVEDNIINCFFSKIKHLTGIIFHKCIIVSCFVQKDSIICLDIGFFECCSCVVRDIFYFSRYNILHFEGVCCSSSSGVCMGHIDNFE